MMIDKNHRYELRFEETFGKTEVVTKGNDLDKIKECREEWYQENGFLIAVSSEGARCIIFDNQSNTYIDDNNIS